MPGRPDVDPKGEGDPKGIPGVREVDLARRSMPGRTSDRRVKGDPGYPGKRPGRNATRHQTRAYRRHRLT